MLGPERLGTANLLTESFTRRGVVVFFCDVDDTLVDTSWLYKIFMSEYASYIARLNGKIDSEVVRETMGNAIKKHFSCSSDDSERVSPTCCFTIRSRFLQR